MLFRSPERTHPYGDLSNGVFTDHFSHMNVARVFPRTGTALWTVPIRDLFPRLSKDEKMALPRDVRTGSGTVTGGIYKVPGWPEGKPLVASYTYQPRFYPPGDMLLVAPLALLYHYTNLSATWVNRWLIVLCLVFAHVAFFLFLRAPFEGGAGGVVGILTLALVYSTGVHWALEGFYDLAAVAPLLLCGRLLAEGRGLPALTAFCAAAALHYRSFFLAPLALHAVVLIFRERSWRAWRRPQWALVAASAVLSFASLYPFALLWPWLSRTAVNCVVNVWGPAVDWSAVAGFALLVALAAGGLVYARAWLDLAVLAWFAFMLTGLREAYEWHVLVPMAWLGLPVITEAPERAPLARLVRLVVFVVVGQWIFASPLAPAWLARVVG